MLAMGSERPRLLAMGSARPRMLVMGSERPRKAILAISIVPISLSKFALGLTSLELACLMARGTAVAAVSTVAAPRAILLVAT